jgi:2-oxoglutarate dehydrogenase E1 component
VFVDADACDRRAAAADTAICRVEQLYPFPFDELRGVIGAYPAVRDVVWLQEEPENMGAWEFVRPLLEEILGGRYPLRYVGRARSSSPSEGSAAWHYVNQEELIARAFDLRIPETQPSLVLTKQA